MGCLHLVTSKPCFLTKFSQGMVPRPGHQHLRHLGCLLRMQFSASYPKLSECSPRPAHPLGSVGFCPDSYVLPSTHYLFTQEKGHACSNCKTEYMFISHTVQSSIRKKSLCIPLMINKLFFHFGMSLQT